MDLRKGYVAPAIAAEDVLEQTSLACNASEPYSTRENGNYAVGGECTTNVNKGGAFASASLCAVVLPNPGAIVVLS